LSVSLWRIARVLPVIGEGGLFTLCLTDKRFGLIE
jgi:hypothetical protein